MSALVLHLELDGFDVVGKNEVVRDVSGNGNNGSLVGNVELVADDTFGACASFDGTSDHHIAVASNKTVKIADDITLEAWVYVRGERSGWVRVVGKGTRKSSRSYGLWYETKGTSTTWLFQRSAGSEFDNCQFTLTHSQLPFNTWCHVTGVVRGKKAWLYLHDTQGRLIKHHELDTKLSGSQLANDDSLTIGYGPDVPLRHNGRIAHVRLYHGPRSLTEIEDDIRRDRLSLAAFRKSHPIDFRVYDEDDQPVLYISDHPDGHALNLELHNTSTQVIQWHNGHGGEASASNYHFAVRFRPGTLSDSTLEALADSGKRATLLAEKDKQDWKVYFPAQPPAANEAASLYVLYTGAAPTFALQPNESRTLTLLRMSAAPGSGARGTQVEFLPAPSTYAVDASTPITGSRTQYVHITNERGLKNIPLHVWLTKGNAVLNDGASETDLSLRISNGSDARDITLAKTSRFVISFDVSDDGWGLTDSTLADSVRVKVGQNELSQVARGQAGQRTIKEWELTFSEQKVLKHRGEGGEPIDLTIKGITTGSSGHANLYVRYEGIPGYQDGQFILTVEKSPLVCSADGNIAIGRLPREKDAPKVDVNGALHVNGHLRNDGGRTVINGFDDARNHWFKTNGDTEAAAVFMSFKGHPNGAAEAVQISPGGAGGGGLFVRKDGHVGIGTLDPQAPLHVKGLLRIDGASSVVNGFDGTERHWIKTNGKKDDAARFMAFVGDPDGEAKGVQISPGGAGGGGLFVNNDGSVGIGDLAVLHKGGSQKGATNPKLQIVGSHRPQDNNADGTTIGEFYSHDRRQGIGISANRVAAIGDGLPNHPGDQYLFLAPKGKGSVVIQGELQIASTHDLKIGGVLRNSTANQPVVISCPDIVDGANTIPEEALAGRTNAIVFWSRGGDLNWMLKDRNGKIHSTWRKSS